MSARHNQKIARAIARAKIGRDRKAALEIMRYVPESALDELTSYSLGKLADAMNKMLLDARERRTVNI